MSNILWVWKKWVAVQKWTLTFQDFQPNVFALAQSLTVCRGLERL